MCLKWKLIPLATAIAVSGCGGSDDDSPTSESEATIEIRSVDAPNCSSATGELSGCWASTCSSIIDDDRYSQMVLSFADGGDVLEYWQFYDNANCVGEAVITQQMFSGLQYEFLPRVESEDEPNADGRIQIGFDGEGWEAHETDDVPPALYDVTVDGNVCFDSSVFYFNENGWGVVLETPFRNRSVDYDNCLSPAN